MGDDMRRKGPPVNGGISAPDRAHAVAMPRGVFNDGNKRTACETMGEALEPNGITFEPGFETVGPLITAAAQVKVEEGDLSSPAPKGRVFRTYALGLTSGKQGIPLTAAREPR